MPNRLVRCLAPLVALVALVACEPDEDAAQGPCPPGFTELHGDCTFDEEAVVDLIVSLESGPLVKVNEEVFVQQLGIVVDRNVWVSPVPLSDGGDAVDLYRSIDPRDDEQVLDAAFPVGTVIVHETVNREEGHTVQVKRDDFVDPNGRPWWFGKYHDNGSPDEVPCSPCESCHNDAFRPGTEGLIGVPREAL